MSQSPQPVTPSNVGRISQIIAGALIVGVLMFAGVAFVTAKGQGPEFPMLALFGAGFAGMTIALRFVIPGIMVSTQTKTMAGMVEPEVSQRLAGLYQTKMIVGMALLEGAAFFNLVAYIADKQIWSYGVVAGLLTIMVISFPSQTQFENWVEDVKRDL